MESDSVGPFMSGFLNSARCFQGSSILFGWMYGSHVSMHSPFDGPLHCFHLRATVDDTAVSMGARVICLPIFSALLGSYLEVEFL